MQEVQKYIVLMVLLGIIAYLFPLFRDFYLVSLYGGNIPYLEERSWELFTFIVIALQNVVAGIWLWALARKDELNKLVWAVFGLVFGLIAVGIFYLVRLNEKLET